MCSPTLPEAWGSVLESILFPTRLSPVPWVVSAVDIDVVVPVAAILIFDFWHLEVENPNENKQIILLNYIGV